MYRLRCQKQITMRLCTDLLQMMDASLLIAMGTGANALMLTILKIGMKYLMRKCPKMTRWREAVRAALAEEEEA